MTAIDSIGTHNLHDGTGRATPFADVIFFTEATDEMVDEVRDTHRVWRCDEQRDLAIAVRRGIEITDVREHYRQVHGGWEKVTPHRGIYWITCRIDGVKHVLVCEHRINAAFPPYIRGEARFRRRMWRRHTRMTCRRLRRWKFWGRKILAGGDLNTPNREVSGYRGVITERGDGFDRVGAHGYHLSRGLHLSREGSDHLRLLAHTH